MCDLTATEARLALVGRGASRALDLDPGCLVLYSLVVRNPQGARRTTRGRRGKLPVPHAALLTLACVLLSATPGLAGDTIAIRDYVTSHQGDIVREFARLLTIPNVASDAGSVRRNAEYIAAELAKRAVEAQLLENDGPPIVFGELRTPGARRTVAVYAHYDGQPVDESQWTTPPWSPVVRKAPVESGGEVVPLASLGRAGARRLVDLRALRR